LVGYSTVAAGTMLQFIGKLLELQGASFHPSSLTRRVFLDTAPTETSWKKLY
jgi:hypothetical protein